MSKHNRPRLYLALIVLVAVFSCGDDEYAACEVPDDCAVPDGATAECLSKGDQGFCTWKCGTDPDCDYDEEEYTRVCAPFESNDEKYCFPDCEGGDDLCPEGLSCRSTGGGNENRKICFPDFL